MMDVKPIPGQEHLPWAEVWLHAVDDDVWREASAAARELGKSGLEVWTTEATPDVVAFFEARGYEEVRRYLRLALDVASAPDPGDPAWELTTLAARPELDRAAYELAVVTHTDQPGREDAVLPEFDVWRGWAVESTPPEAFVIALADGEPIGFANLVVDGDEGYHGMTAVLREWRGRGVAEAIKRAQIRWAKARGLRVLRTANEVRIAAIRRINERYGYTPEPAEIVLRGPLAALD